MHIKTLKQHYNHEYADLPKHWLEDWLLHIIDKPRSFLITNDDYQLTKMQCEQFATGVKSMREGTPVAYLLGSQPFWSLDFYVNQHTLIPRPDTEVLVEYVLEWINQHQAHIAQDTAPYQLLDLGTGTGCIAISLGYELGNSWQITAVDSSEQALAVTQKNIDRHQLTNVATLASSWFENIAHNPQYHVIVSNPPYIDSSDSHLTKLIKEPITALVADNKGMADIEKIVNNAREYLLDGGLLAIEHGYDQRLAVQACLLQAGFVEVQTIQDYGNNDRVTIGLNGLHHSMSLLGGVLDDVLK